MDCLFCTIAAKKTPAEIVYEDGTAIAFLDIHPKAPGHTVVILKSHAETILDAPPETLGPLFRAVQAVVARIKDRLHPAGFTIGINHGVHAGQAIDHMHVHIIPRFAGDGGGSIHTIVTNTPKESIHAIAEQLRTNHNN